MRNGIYLLACCLSLRAETVTFTKQISPILFEKCAPCHRPGESAPFPLLTYEDARKHARQIADVTRRRFMPPWPPEPGYGDFADVRRLSDRQLDLLSRWAQGGAVEGDPAQLPPAPHFVEGWQLGEPDLILHITKPYHLAAGGGDVFRNFVLPVNLTRTRYVRAMELRPGEKRVVHHANLIVDRGRQLRRRDGLDGQPGFSGMDVETEASGEFDPESHLLFWKPGTPALEEPDDMAWRLDPGSDLIVNLHLQPSGKPEIVDASVGLYFTDRAPTRKPMLVQLEHDGQIDIPAGARHSTVTDHLKLPMPVQVLAIYPHAHYLGKEIEAWAELPGGGRVPLLLIKDWDINWQAEYTYRKPVELPAGSTVAMRIVYDNSVDNLRNPNRPPVRVRAGNRSSDEMGHVWLQLLPVAQGDVDPRLILQQAVMRRRLEKYPADFLAHFNLGASYQAMGKPEEALPFLKDAVRIRPESATARNNLASSLAALERPDEAIGQYQAALRLDPGYQDARYNLASVLASKGEAQAALAELTVYLKTSPDDMPALELAGRMEVAAGRVSESLAYFRRAAALAPDNGAVQTNLGAALAMQGDLPAAIAAFEAALKADPDSQPARENLERARARLEGKQ